MGKSSRLDLPTDLVLKIVALGKRDLRTKLKVKPGRLKIDPSLHERLNNINRLKLGRKRAAAWSSGSAIKGHCYKAFGDKIFVFKPSNCLVAVQPKP